MFKVTYVFQVFLNIDKIIYSHIFKHGKSYEILFSLYGQHFRIKNVTVKVIINKNFKILTAPNEIKSVQKLCAACEVVKMMTFHSKALILHQFSSVQILSRVQLFAFP